MRARMERQGKDRLKTNKPGQEGKEGWQEKKGRKER